MTVTYQGHNCGHQQLWALVAALNADGYTVKMGAMPATGMWAWIRRYDDNDGEDRCVESYLRRGETGDRTPFRAVKRAVEKMQRAHAADCAIALNARHACSCGGTDNKEIS